MSKSVNEQAVATVDAAGQAGGIDEVRRLAERGWPEHVALDGDSPDLRAAIQAEAQRVVAKVRAEAVERLATASEDDEDLVDEAAELFEAIFSRRPDADDGDPGDWISHCYSTPEVAEAVRAANEVSQ